MHTSFFYFNFSSNSQIVHTMSITITVVGSFKLNIKFFERKKISRINVVVSIMRLSLLTSVFFYSLVIANQFGVMISVLGMARDFIVYILPTCCWWGFSSRYSCSVEIFYGTNEIICTIVLLKMKKKQFKTQILTNKTQVTNKIQNTTLLNRIFSLLLLFTAITCRDAQTIWVIHKTSFPVMEKITSKSELLSNEYLLFE